MTDEVLEGQADQRIGELPIELYDERLHLHAFRRALASLRERGVREGAGQWMWLHGHTFGPGTVVVLEGTQVWSAARGCLGAALGRLDAAMLPRPPVLLVVPRFHRDFGPKVAPSLARHMERDLASQVAGVRVIDEADAITQVLGLDPAPFLQAEQSLYDEAVAHARSAAQRRRDAVIEAIVAGGWPRRVRRILVVDDQELSLQVLTAILVKKGGVAPEAIDTSDGTDVLERRFSDPPPDLLILDAGLPGQDAAALVRAIRVREAEDGLPPVPIASLTAEVTDAFRRELIQAGIDLFLCKPASTMDVLAAARTLVTRTPRPLRRILVVDDSEINIRVVRQILEGSLPDADVETLTDPIAGLARCLTGPRPELLIVNGAMPILTGPVLIRELRATESRDALPPMSVVIESAGTDYLEAGLGAGAHLAISLPWDSLELMLCVQALFPGAPVVLPARRA